MMVADVSKLCKRDEDIFCIYNTIALFLEHQNFTKTSEVFEDECAIRGFNRKRNSEEAFDVVAVEEVPEEVDIELEALDYQLDALSIRSGGISKVNKKTAQVTYVFEDAGCKTERCDTASSHGTYHNTLQDIKSCVSVEDYVSLKEKFLELQDRHKQLMDELYEKTRYLDRLIPLLERSEYLHQQLENIKTSSNELNEVKPNVPSKRCRSIESKEKNHQTIITTDETDDKYYEVVKLNSSPRTPCLQSRMDQKKSPYKVHCDINDSKYNPHGDAAQLDALPNSCIIGSSYSVKSSRNSAQSIHEVAPTESVETVAVTVSNITLTRSSEYSLLGLGLSEIAPKDRIDEVNFLFSRKKSQHIQSAPARGAEECKTKGDATNTEMCFSMPLSPRKQIPDNQYFDLDFVKLKQDLMVEQDERKLLVMQALRWRLTRSSTIERGYIINSYVCNDLLSLFTESSLLDLQSRGNAGDDLREGIWRLINVIASLKQGRDYLCSSDKAIRVNMVATVRKQLWKAQKISTPLEMLIVTLQKVSIRKQQRRIMVKEGLLQTMSELLTARRQEVSAYCLEYSCALFMNLCLDEDAKTKCAHDPSPIVKVLSCLLDGVQDKYMPYISGALYSILSEDSVQKEALRQGIDVMIFHQMKKTKDKYLRKQLEFIMRSRFNGEGANFTCSENLPLEEVDLLEPELDENDHLAGPKQGEALLEIYKLKQEDGSQSGQSAPKSVAEINPTHYSNKTKSTSTVTSPTTVDSSCNPVRASPKIKFDAEISTGTGPSMFPKNSLVEYSDVFGSKRMSATCDCLGPAKYTCGCYDAIRKSVEEDERIFELSPKDLPENRNLTTAKIKEHNSLFPVSSIPKPRLTKTTSPAARNFDHICDLWRRGIIDCVCYREVFLSRPKLDRTPPLSPKINKSQ